MVVLQKGMRLGWHAQFRAEPILMATYLVTALRTCPPRTISTSDCKTPVMICTDGAYEPELGIMTRTAGVVVVDFLTGLKAVQAVQVSKPVLDHWARHGSKQLIAYLELWPVLTSLHNYGESLTGRQAVFFIDNNAVFDALIKESSPIICFACWL